MYPWVSGAALYLVTVVSLLRYVFRSEVMTPDQLFAAILIARLAGAYAPSPPREE